MLLVDHGVFRVAYLNYHRLDDQAARCAQPTPRQIAGFARRGVKTIVNLRGARECGSYWLEEEACAVNGLELINFQARSRAAPTKAEIYAARDLFRRVTYPMVMHCKSGADRAGLMSVLYLFIHRGVPLETAKNQLSLRYGHVRQAKTGILDFFFEAYLSANAAAPLDFFDWLEHQYDPAVLVDEFQSNGFADRIVDSLLRRE